IELRAVQFQERLARYRGGALVAVAERTVAREPVCERRGEVAEIRWRIAVRIKLPRACERRFEQRIVPHAGCATVLRKLSLVDGERQRLSDPDHRYLASLLSNVRRLRMTRSATSICCSSSGSKGVSLTPLGSSVA